MNLNIVDTNIYIVYIPVHLSGYKNISKGLV